jgi:penicillin amidase
VAAEKTTIAEESNGRVTILRDEYGVPHVYASTERSLWYGVGYAQGQDRLWQAEVLRRTAKGTSAEIFGPGAVGGDISIRALFGPADRFTALLESASPRARFALKEFAAGMNAWIEEATATGQLPVEFAAFGYTPEPWVEEDTVAIVATLLFNFGEGGSEELTNAAHLEELIARFGPAGGLAVFSDTHWLNDPDAPTTAPAPAPVSAAIQSPRRDKAAKMELPTAGAEGNLPSVAGAMKALERNFERAGLERGPASNAMIISPRLSVDGRALLLSGPQMGYTTPQINHEIGMHRAGINITGMEIAGVPWIPIGVTDEFAWGLTTGGTDNMDWYVEVLNPMNPGQYLFQGQWLDFDCRLETFGVAGAPDVNEVLCETVHGPVLGAAPGIALSLKRAVRGFEMETYQVFFDLLESRSVSDVDDALAGFAACLNFFYADIRGNIAYWHMGKIPVRAEGDNPWLPHDGTGAAEWQGFIPWEEMPRALNPAQGWISSWNNKPRPDWDNSTLGFWNWGTTGCRSWLPGRRPRRPSSSSTSSVAGPRIRRPAAPGRCSSRA